MKAAIIGAGAESLHTIAKAKELGVEVTAFDGNPRAEGLRAADRGIVADISDEAAVLAALRPEKPDFLLTAPIGRYLTATGAANDALGLPGLSGRCAVLCTDKFLFHRKLEEKGLRPCHCYLIRGESGSGAEIPYAPPADAPLTYPAILKPRYGSGSRGIFYLTAPVELTGALRLLREGETAEDYVLEEAVQGVEYGADGAVTKDGLHLILLRRKLLTPPPARQAVGYLAALPGEQPGLYRRVSEYLACISEQLGLSDCLFHADLMIGREGSGVFAIEVSARPSGHYLHDVFTPLAAGVDMAGQYIRYRCGLPCSFRPECRRRLLIRYFDLQDCTVKRAPRPEELTLPEGVRMDRWDCRVLPGTRLEEVTTGHSVMGRGYFILSAAEIIPERTLTDAADSILGEFEICRTKY